MKHSSGRCRVNAIQVTEVTIENLPNRQLSVESVYALGETVKGAGIMHGTHGKCTAYTHNWSEDTIKLLHKLLASMEEDLLPRHFEMNAGMEDDDEGIESGTDEEASQI